MGVLQKFREWWKSSAPVNREELAEDFDAYLREKRIEERQTLKLIKPRLEHIVRIAFAHLEPEALDLLVKRAHKGIRSEGELSTISEALRDGLIADFFRGKRIPYGFVCEARYFEKEDISNLNKLLRVNGIEQDFVYVSPNELNVPAHLLESFFHFLEPIGWTCVGLDTGSDEFCVFITRSTAYPKLLEAATLFDVSVTDKPYLM